MQNVYLPTVRSILNLFVAENVEELAPNIYPLIFLINDKSPNLIRYIVFTFIFERDT